MENIVLGYAKISSENQSEAMIFIHSFIISHQTIGLKPSFDDLIIELKEGGFKPTEKELEEAKKLIANVKEDKEVQQAICEKFGL